MYKLFKKSFITDNKKFLTDKAVNSHNLYIRKELMQINKEDWVC